MAHGNELHLVFVDLKKAYDSVPIKQLWKGMNENNIPINYINAVKEMYKEKTSHVKLKTRISEAFTVNKGLSQGRRLSLTLFKIYLTLVLKEWMRKYKYMGMQIGDRNIYTMLFAYDQVILADDEDDASYMILKLMEQYEKWGLEINIEKNPIYDDRQRWKRLQTKVL